MFKSNKSLHITNTTQVISGYKTIWIIGSSLIHWAELEASRSPGGRSLHLQGASICWIGQKGLKFHDKGLDKLVDSKRLTLPNPDYIVIHCGANDITELVIDDNKKNHEGEPLKKQVSGLQLFDVIKTSLLRYNALFKNTTIIWSTMLQRRYWHFAPLGDGPKVEKKRKDVNRMVKNFVIKDINGAVISHDQNISAQDLHLFRTDGTHLSKLGNKIFLNNLKGGIEAIIQSKVHISI